MMLVLCLSIVASLPYPFAYGEVAEGFPTETEVIVAGWVNPTGVYADDNNYAYCEVEGAKQNYTGFGFSLNSSCVIDSVFLEVEWLSEAYIEPPYYEFDLALHVTYPPFKDVFYVDEWFLEYMGFSAFSSRGVRAHSKDITDDYEGGWNYTTVNGFWCVLDMDTLTGLSGGSYGWGQVDYVKVIVSYHVQSENGDWTLGFAPGVFFGLLFMILPLFLVFRKK